MNSIRDMVINRLSYLEEQKPLLYAHMKRRTGDPIRFVAGLIDEHFSDDAPGDFESASKSLNAILAIYEGLLAGNVYKK